MGRPGYILVARQMGKTNLLLNAKRELASAGDIFAYVDLSKPFETERECFRHIVDTVVDAAPAEFTDALHAIPGQRLESVPAYKEHEAELRLILRTIPGKLIITLDEIDSLTNTAFSDRIFAQIRSVYFSRVNIPEFARLTYVLSGVVDPNEIIKDKRISPFNIGHKIYLDDFTREEFADFVDRAKLNLDEEVANRVYTWTQGNPRMTWDVCARLEEARSSGKKPSVDTVDSEIRSLYLSGFNRAPVDHIRELVSESPELRIAVRSLQSGALPSLSDEIRNRLYLAGIVASVGAASPIQLKNPIIAAALAEEWLNDITIKKKGLLRTAADRFDEKDYREALSLYDQYLREQQAFPTETADLDFFRMASSAYALGDYERAVALYNSSDLRYDIFPVVYLEKQLHLGICYYQLGSFDESVSAFREVLKYGRRDNTYVSSLINLGAAQLASAKNAEAEESFRQVVDVCRSAEHKLAGDDAKKFQCAAHYNLASMFRRDGNNSDALSEYESALAVADIHQKPTVLLGLASVAGRKSDAANALRAAIEVIRSENMLPQRAHPDAPLRLSPDTYLRILKDVFFHDREAFNQFAAYALTRTPAVAASEAHLYFSLAAACFQAGDNDGGIELLKVVLTKPGADESLTFSTYRYLCFFGDNTDSADYFSEYLRRFTGVDREEEVVLADLQVFARAIEYYIEHAQFKSALEWLSAISAHREKVSVDLRRNFAVLSFLELRLYQQYGLASNALAVARDLIDFIDNLPERPLEASLLDAENLTSIRQFAERVLNRGVAIDPKTLHGHTVGRNDKVSVRYKNGTIKSDIKYKRVAEDLSKGLCELIPNVASTPPSHKDAARQRKRRAT